MVRDETLTLAVTGFFGQTMFRYANYDTPFWARKNKLPGRWHQPGDGATQYLSLDPAGAWADLARREDLRTEEELELVRMTIWAVSLQQSNLVDYGSFDRADAAGFPPDALVDDDYTRCQIEGARLRAAGYAGVVATSAALPGGTNITLFGERVLSSWAKPTRLASSIPGCIVAVGGPPPGLAARVRYRGQPHQGYIDWIEAVAEDARARQLEQPPELDPEQQARVRRELPKESP